MRIILTGATGFIGSRLVPMLEGAGHSTRILGRSPRPGLPQGSGFSIWDPAKGPPPREALDGCDAVIHLAGEPVAQRWSPEIKRRIRSSRIDVTGQLVEALSELSAKPKVLVCASAVGCYGDRGDEVLTESSSAGKGFLAGVCVEWERAANAAAGLGLRVVLLRTGIVLGRGGGALERMLPPFRVGLGGKLGSGKQWMPWIHLDDLCAMIHFAVERPEVQGPLNGTAPNPVRNEEFTRALGRALQRPALIPVPEFAIRLLYGEMAQIMFASQRAVPRAALAAGFEFRFPELFGALKDVLG
ncbi:MAG: TIGR01777 family oxidoreductase [Bryobacteraceae bacterium]